jgi:hypothetical protein
VLLPCVYSCRWESLGPNPILIFRSFLLCFRTSGAGSLRSARRLRDLPCTRCRSIPVAIAPAHQHCTPSFSAAGVGPCCPVLLSVSPLGVCLCRWGCLFFNRVFTRSSGSALACNAPAVHRSWGQFLRLLISFPCVIRSVPLVQRTQERLWASFLG